jgi:alpha-tubulin suppressor-like RCC1 family protein
VLFFALGCVVGCSGPTAPNDLRLPVTPQQLAAGIVHTCLLRGDGDLVCWGRAGLTPSPTTNSPPTVVRAPDGLRFAAVSASASTCALTDDGQLWCFGQNLYGEVGDGTREARTAPVAALTDQRFSVLAVGGYVGCALERDGRAFCWGNGSVGAMGNGVWTGGDPAVQSRPAAVLGGRTFTALAGGSWHCALTTDGAAYCWGGVEGSFDTGRIVLEGSCTDRYYIAFFERGCTVPTRLGGPTRFVSLGGSGGPTMCGLTSSGAAYCWGEGWLGTLGNGRAGEGVGAVEPESVATALRFSRITAGASHVCALTLDGAAYCWGNNYRGYLGNGADGRTGGVGGATTPVPVSGGHRFTTIAAGAYHTCAIATSGDVWCWGAGDAGELGGGPTGQDSDVPIRVALPTI